VIEVFAALLLVLASALVFKQLLAADGGQEQAPARPAIRRRRPQAAPPLRKAA
jgi:hypothetical protein